MIHVILGTKAQMVKMAPLMALFEKAGVEYNFIFTGQHQETIDDIRNNFSLKTPDCTLYCGKDVTSILKMMLWSFSVFLKVLWRRKEVFKGDRGGIVLVHGDTFSTALGGILGKLFGHRVGHVESGLRSFRIFHPFPEELTRLFVFALADYYYCPGAWALSNVSRYKGVKIDTRFNTQLDAVRAVWDEDRGPENTMRFESYCLISTHRFENWNSRSVSEKNVELIERIVAKVPGIFVLHSITKKRLQKYELLERLSRNPKIQFRDRSDFRSFISLINASQFVVTDGGSNQEECSYIGKPCLLLRKASERQEGIGRNVVVSAYSKAVVDEFVENYMSYEQPPLFNQASPCALILEHLKKETDVK